MLSHLDAEDAILFSPPYIGTVESKIAAKSHIKWRNPSILSADFSIFKILKQAY